MVAAAGPVRQIAALRDDAFEAEPAGVLEHGRPVRLEMLAEADRRVLREPGDDLRQQVLAVEQCRLGQIEALAIEEIEREVAEAVVAAGLQVGLQMAQAGNAGGVLDDDLAVDQRRAEAELAASASAMPRNRAVQSSPLRVSSRTLPPSMRAWMR